MEWIRRLSLCIWYECVHIGTAAPHACNTVFGRSHCITFIQRIFCFFFFFVGFCWCSILLLRTFMGISHDTHVMLRTERNEWNEYDSLSSLRTAIAGTVDATVVYARYEIYRFSWNAQKSVCVHCLLDICVRDLCTFDNSAIHLSEHFRRH